VGVQKEYGDDEDIRGPDLNEKELGLTVGNRLM
jgi:hypothetical protein